MFLLIFEKVWEALTYSLLSLVQFCIYILKTWMQ